MPLRLESCHACPADLSPLQRLVKAATAMDTILQVLTSEPVPVRQLQPRAPRDLQSICMKCLQKKAQKRYASSFDLAEDLYRYLISKPVQARPVSAWSSITRWVR